MRSPLYVSLSLLLYAPVLQAMSTAELDQAWLGLQTPQVGLDSRFTYCIFLEAVAANWHPERYVQLLTTCQAEMDLNPQSPTYGNCGTTYGVAPSDPNVGVFCMQSAVIVWDKFSSNLTTGEIATLHALMTAGLSHIKNYAVTPDYTNIYLLKTCEMIALGEALGDSQAANSGYGMLPNFLTYTQHNGIHEFDSPTYYGVDLEALGTLQKLTQNTTASTQANMIQNLIWTDIAANWYAPAERIGGTHSRDHDYLHGAGKCDTTLQSAGWLVNRVPSLPEASPASTSSYMSIASTTPPSWAQAVRQIVPRTIVGQWGMQWQNSPWLQRTSYIGHHVSLGSSGGSYNSEDKLINVDLPGSDDSIINLFYVLDGYGSPYGTAPIANGLGNTSLQHLQPMVLSQQRDTDVLSIISEKMPKTDPKFPTLTGVHSDIIIPYSASMWSGETAIGLPNIGASTVLPLSTPLFIRQQDCVVAVRFLYAVDVTGLAAHLSLVNDGSTLGACRLLCEHSRGAPISDISIQVVIHMRVAEGLDDAGFAMFRNSFENAADQAYSQGGVLDAVAGSSTGSIHLAINTATNQPTIFPPATNQVLAINGVDVGLQIIQGQIPQFPNAPGATTGGTTGPSGTTSSGGTTSGSATGATSSGSTSGSFPSSPGSQSKEVAAALPGSSSGSSSGCGIGSGVGVVLLILRSHLRSRRSKQGNTYTKLI